MLPDFNRLKVFYYIYAENSIVAASRLLHLTQPAVSQQLRKLEHELQAPLFIRLHKKLVPTEAAKRLFALVQPFVDNLQGEIEDIAQPLDRPAGILRIGAPREFGKEYLPLLAHSFRQNYPDVRFRFSFDENVPLLNRLKNGDLDFVLFDFFMPQAQFDTPQLFSIDPLVDEELILACSWDYYQREIEGDHSFVKLAGKSFISDEDELVFLQHWFRHHFRKVPAKLNVVMTTNSHEALISGLRLGMGLGLTSTHLVYEDLTAGRIVPITTGRKNSISWIALVQLQDKVPSLTEKSFISHLRQGVQQEEVLKKFVKSYS